MKLFDKIKDLFTDEIIEEKEEIIEIKEEKKEERKLPKIMRETKEGKDEIIHSTISDKDLFKDFGNLEIENNNINNNNDINSNFRFPISFEDNDLLDEKILSNQNIMHREQHKDVEMKVVPPVEIYPTKQKKEEEVKFFKVSPVISPVYGILDKNYKKEEVQAKPKSSNELKRTNQKVDFESVRKKAYGSLIDDIKDNLSSVKVEEKREEKFEDFYDLKEDISEITLGEIENNFSDFGITIDDYKNKEKEHTIKENTDEVKIMSFDEKEVKAEKIEIKDPVINLKKQEEDFVEDSKNDDIFNLIDNMYQESEEDDNDRR